MDWTRLPLARAATDRAAHLRTEQELARLWQDPTTRLVVVVDGRLATDGSDRLALLAVEEVAHRLGTDPLVALLGVDDDRAYLAVVLEPAMAAGLPTAHLRDVGHRLPDLDAGLATAAVALAAWHERHRCCPVCGSPTDVAAAGWTRRCSQDGTEHYPRTDPAIIVAVRDEADRLLLGHAAHWPERRFSTLAGYVEPGESAEQAVHREVGEEVGVQLGAVVYRGSQPWPFPASLMLAYAAQARTTALRPDGVEVTDARWFTRDELARAVARGEVLLPMRASVARALIEEWFGGPVADPPT